jgi:hypothetical protein
MANARIILLIPNAALQARVALNASSWKRLCTPGMGMNLWGASPLSEDIKSIMLTIVTTSRRQGQYREVLSEGSLSAKRRADEQESDTRLRSRVEQAQDCNGRMSALYSKSGGCVVIVHVLIRGDLRCVQFDENGAAGSNARRNTAEVSSGRSSDGCTDAHIAKDQRRRTGQRLLMLDACVACDRREVSLGA